jgi:hypothetical protein
MSCRLTVQRLVLGWTRPVTASAGNIRFQPGDFGSRSQRLTWLHKKTTIRIKQYRGIGGRVMVQRTDIAGSIGCSMGQVSRVDDGVCRHATNGIHTTAPSSKKVIFQKPLPIRTAAERSAAVC